MKIFTTVVVLAICFAVSDATFKLFNSIATARKQYQPLTGHTAADFLASNVVPVPSTATYARFTPTHGKEIAKYEVSPSSVVIYTPSPLVNFAAQPYSVPVYPQTLAVDFSSPYINYYSDSYTSYAEPLPSSQVIEVEHCPICHEIGDGLFD